jgi:hypothetical protein
MTNNQQLKTKLLLYTTVKYIQIKSCYQNQKYF